MKICPRCQKTYADDNLNFCLEDGSVLQHAGGPPPTVQVSAPPITQQPVTQQTQGNQPAWNVPPQQYSMQPAKKSSKAWIWVLLILGLVVVVCGGGFAGLVLIGMNADKNNPGNVTTTTNTGGKNTTTTTTTTTKNGTTPSNSSTTSSGSTRTDAETVDLSDWVRDNSLYGN